MTSRFVVSGMLGILVTFVPLVLVITLFHPGMVGSFFIGLVLGIIGARLGIWLALRKK